MISMNTYQERLWKSYLARDKDARLIGLHRGRPVVQAYMSMPLQRIQGEARHVVVLGKTGVPVDLGSSWQEGFEPIPSVPFREAHSIIEDWLSWSIRV